MKIGITCSYKNDGDQELYFVGERYINALDGSLVLLPRVNSDDIEKQIDGLDGVVLIGGCDVNPIYYDEHPSIQLGETDYLRDSYEIALVRQCYQKEIPVLGICRGMQIMNVAFGGTLYQDIGEIPHTFLHQQKDKRNCPSHFVHIEQDSLLYSVFGDGIYVNSFHHQALKDVAPIFKVTARSDDGIIEAIEDCKGLLNGVQFHPECMIDNELMRKFMNAFIRE